MPRNLNDSTAVTVLFMMGGGSLEVHYHLHSFERVELQVVETAPDSQLLKSSQVKSSQVKLSFIVIPLHVWTYSGTRCRASQEHGAT